MLRSMDLSDYLRKTYGPILNCGFLGLRIYQSETELYYKFICRGEDTVYGKEVLEFKVDLLNRPVGYFSLADSLVENVTSFCQDREVLIGEGIIFPENNTVNPSRPSVRPVRCRKSVV